ncbi:MAG: hypothetical protein AAGT88_05385 [Dethiobacter sp.]
MKVQLFARRVGSFWIRRRFQDKRAGDTFVFAKRLGARLRRSLENIGIVALVSQDTRAAFLLAQSTGDTPEDRAEAAAEGSAFVGRKYKAVLASGNGDAVAGETEMDGLSSSLPVHVCAALMS